MRRLLVVAHVGWGTLLLSRPEPVLEAGRAPSGPPAEAIVRVLGARHLLQGALVRTRPRLSAGVDVLHAATMVPLAVRRAEVRRAASLSATVSGLFAGASLLSARRGR